MRIVKTIRTACSFKVTIFLLLLGACSPDKEIEKSTHNRLKTDLNESEAIVLSNRFWKEGESNIQQLFSEAIKLEQTITLLLDNPTSIALDQARQQWRATALSYYALQPYLHINIAREVLDRFKFNIGAWPIQPGFLDSFGPYVHSGIINDIAFQISAKNLREQHGLTDEEEVTLGLHAIEFILWPNEKTVFERLKAQNRVPQSLANDGLKVEELPNNRRRLMLQLQSQILSEDIRALKHQWQVKGTLASTFSKITTEERLAAIHWGLLRNLQQIHGQLLTQTSNEEVLSINSFAGLREIQLAATLKSIHELYFDKPDDEVSTLARLFPPGRQQQLISDLLLETKRKLEDSKPLTEVLESLDKALILMTP